MALFLNCLMIFSVRIVDVSLGTLSTVLVIRGKKGLGSIIGFVDLIIWFLVVRQALSIENAGLWVTLAYAGGYATGTYIGSWLEEKMAIGSSSLTVITRGLRYDLVTAIRSNGFGISVVKCDGKENNNLMLLIEVDRKKVEKVKDIINRVAPDSFIAISDTKQIINGYFR